MAPARRAEEADRWRAHVHLRSPRSAVTTKRRALNFIERVGFCLVFGGESTEVPSLWRAVHGWHGDGAPRIHPEKDPSAFLWELKQVLPSEHSVYYAKLLLRRPTMISLDMLPYFYALSGRTGERDEFIRTSVRGGLSPMARRIMEAFGRRSHLSTRQLKQTVLRGGVAGSGSFAQAMTELQTKMFIAKGDEDRRPFSFTWSPVRILFAPQIRKAHRISAQQARRVILEQHFRNQLVCTVLGIRRVFGWTRQEVYQPLGELLSRGIIGSEGSVEGTTGRSYILLR